MMELVRQRCAEAPHRSLVVGLGSSRTLMCLRTERLNRGSDPAAPLVFNCSALGCGPMMQQVLLRRLLAEGFHPERVILEVLPASLSARDGAPIEERWKFTYRYNGRELAQLWRYYSEPVRLLHPWLLARALPLTRHRNELHDALALDRAAAVTPGYNGRDAYGWGKAGDDISAEEAKRKAQIALAQYGTALTQPAPAPGAVEAVRDLVKLCRHEGIAVHFIVPPEGSVFRAFAPAVAESQMNVVRDLARELAVDLTDARTWVDDDGFWDGHHTNPKGADQYTERFGREVMNLWYACPGPQP
jgi:hypothetical protein